MTNHPEHLLQALEELAGDSASLSEWLQQPNTAFAGEIPLALIVDGHSDRLWEMVH